MPSVNQVVITIDRLEEERAVVRTDQGEEFALPVSLLPVDVSEGAKLWLKITVDEGREASQEDKARYLLHQILNRSS